MQGRAGKPRTSRVYLSGAVLLGLVSNSLFGREWATAVAALVIAAFAIREGIEASQGDVESPFEMLRRE